MQGERSAYHGGAGLVYDPRMSHVRIALLVGLMSCARNQGTAVPPEPAPTAADPAPVTVPDDATVATAEAPVEPPPAATEPPGLAPPTEAEFAAWDRKDPAADAKLAEFDKANLDRMLGYWNDLACFRVRMRTEGELAFGQQAGGPAEERFYQFKKGFIVELDEWQQNFFAKEPRVLEKSKFPGRLLEAHEIVAYAYPKAFASGDAKELEKAEAWWVVVEAKTKKYTESLGGTWKAAVCDAKATKKTKAKKTK